jgi:hypothetical protein
MSSRQPANFLSAADEFCIMLGKIAQGRGIFRRFAVQNLIFVAMQR